MRCGRAQGALPQQQLRRAVLEDVRVTRDDFLGALKRVQPSAMREVMVQAPKTRWSDIGGLDAARNRCVARGPTAGGG